MQSSQLVSLPHPSMVVHEEATGEFSGEHLEVGHALTSNSGLYALQERIMGWLAYSKGIYTEWLVVRGLIYSGCHTMRPSSA